MSAELRLQAEAMSDTPATLLAEAGWDARAVLRTTLYLIDYDHFAEIDAIYRERLPEPYPARDVPDAPRPWAGLGIHLSFTAAA